MAKRFKMKFTMPSFQLCRSKDPSSFPGNPVLPAIYRLSPVNPKTRDIIRYPNNLPVPPPTPEFIRSNNNKVSSSSTLVSLRHGCQMCRDHHDKQVRNRGRKSTSSVPSRRSNNNDLPFDHNKLDCSTHDEDDESQTLISCTASFSDEFLCDYSNKQQGDEKELVISEHGRKIISSAKKVQRLSRFQTSENGRREKVKEHPKKKKTETKSSTVEGKVKESLAVVKKSKDPHKEFKRSMVEMIKEMEMSEAEDLEQLLQCFLALNSRTYHEVIVRAFMEIWQQMFVLKPQLSTKNQSPNRA